MSIGNVDFTNWNQNTTGHDQVWKKYEIRFETDIAKRDISFQMLIYLASTINAGFVKK